MDENEWIDQDTVRFFIWSVKKFFNVTTGIEAEVGAPYLLDNINYSSYAGVIGVSGSQRGAVYFNIEQKFLDEVLVVTYPELKDRQDMSPEMMEDMRIDYTGEIANIISGNVRNYMGENFLISVPVVITSPGEAMKLPDVKQKIIFPINWEGHQCYLILCLEQNQVIAGSSAESAGAFA